MIAKTGACLLALTTIVSSNPARANEFHEFLQISCVPELGYFAIRKIGVWDPPEYGPYLTEGLDPGTQVLADLANKYHLYSAEQLAKRPQACQIPALAERQGWHEPFPATEVRVVGRYNRAHNDKAGLERQMMDYAEVFVRGVNVGKLDLSLYAWAGDFESIEVSAYEGELAVRVCKYDHETHNPKCGDNWPPKDWSD